MCIALPICAGTHRCDWLILKYQEKYSGWKQAFSAHRDYYLPTGFVDASRATPWELISRIHCLRNPDKPGKQIHNHSLPAQIWQRSLLQLSLWGGNRVLLLLLGQGLGTRGHSPGSPCQAAPDCLPGVSANKGCRKTQSPLLMWFGKGSQVQPEESLAEKVQFCISSFILRGRSVRSEDHTKKESGGETKYLYSACLFFQFTLHICL